MRIFFLKPRLLLPSTPSYLGVALILKVKGSISAHCGQMGEEVEKKTDQLCLKEDRRASGSKLYYYGRKA